MPKARAVLIAVLLSALTSWGCSVLRVSACHGEAARCAAGSPKAESLAGVPFHKKELILRAVSEYELTWMQATLEELPPGSDPADDKVKPLRSQTTPYMSSDCNTSALARLRAVLGSIAAGGTGDAGDAWDAFGTLNAFDPATADGLVEASPARFVVGHRTERTFEVDTGTTYYLNGAMPWFGAAQLSSELSSDGTLSKVDAKAEPKVLDLLTAFVPLKEFLTAKYVPTTEDAAEATAASLNSLAQRTTELRKIFGSAATLEQLRPFLEMLRPPEPSRPPVFRLTIENQGFHYTARIRCAAEPCPLAPIDYRLAEVSRKPLPLSKVPDKPDPTRAVDVAAQILLPKKP